MIRLEFERRKRRWSQHDLARLSGVHQHDISQIERGRLVAREEELARLSTAFGIAPASVLLKPVSVAAEPEEAVAR